MLKRLWCGYIYRSFSNSTVLRYSDKLRTPEPTSVQSSQPNESILDTSMSIVPSEFDKRILLLSGKYKSREEIPSRIRLETMDHAKSKVRIRVANVLIIITLISCVGVVMLGKKRQREGNTFLKKQVEKEDKLREEGRLQRENKAF